MCASSCAWFCIRRYSVANCGARGPLRRADRSHEARPFVMRADRDRQPSIVVVAARPASVGAVRRRRRFLRAPSRRRLLASVDRHVEQRRTDQADQSLELREVDELSLTRLPLAPQAEQCRHRTGEPGGRIRVRVAETGGPALFVGHIQGEAGERLQSGAEADVAGARPGVSEPRHAEADDIGLDFNQAGVIHPPLTHDAGGKVVDHQVADFHQPMGDFDRAGGRHVERDRKLVAVEIAVDSDRRSRYSRTCAPP